MDQASTPSPDPKGAVSIRVEREDRAFRKTVTRAVSCDLFVAEPAQPVVCCNPDVSCAILLDDAHIIMSQTLPGRVRSEAAGAATAQPLAPSADPKIPVAILIDGADDPNPGPVVAGA